MRTRTVLAAVLSLLVMGALVAPPADAQARVRLPDTTVVLSDSVRLPVVVSGLAGQEVFSWQADLRYDPTVLDTVTVETRGTLAEGRRVRARTPRPGRLSVAVAGTTPVGAWDLLIGLRVRGDTPGTTPLAWESVQFNEGTPGVHAADGHVTVVEPDTSNASK